MEVAKVNCGFVTSQKLRFVLGWSTGFSRYSAEYRLKPVLQRSVIEQLPDFLVKPWPHPKNHAVSHAGAYTPVCTQIMCTGEVKC
jgi:hypothetical protein